MIVKRCWTESDVVPVTFLFENIFFVSENEQFSRLKNVSGFKRLITLTVVNPAFMAFTHLEFLSMAEIRS